MNVVESSTAIIERCPARAALAGNPSDGYGGAVLSVPVTSVAATVTVRPADRFTISDGRSPARSIGDWDDLVATAASVRVDDDHSLILASIAYVAPLTGALQPVTIELSTTIPRSVGLAGSSAIVIATIRALLRSSGRAQLDAVELAERALSVEADHLGITAGLQDRVVQSFGCPTMMRFGHGPGHGHGHGHGQGHPIPYMTVAAGEPGFALFVAHRAGTADPSQVVHGRLRQRFEAGEATVIEAMTELAVHAEHAADAYAAGDATRLGAAMDATFDVRNSMIDLDPHHVEMIRAARRAGAFANYTGSGGSIVVLAADPSVEREAQLNLVDAGCEIIAL